LPVLLLLCVAVALSAWILHMIRSEVWVQHTYNVLAEINEAQRRLVDQETGLRAYILTADPMFLQPYVDGSRKFRVSITTLRRIDELQQRYRQWLREAEEEKRIVGATRESPLRDLPSRQRLVLRKQQMDRMRVEFATMHGEEQRLLAMRQAESDRANVTLFAVGTVLVVVFAAVLFFFLRRQLARIDDIYLAKVNESERARLAAEGLAAEVREQAAAMEQAMLAANRERDTALRALAEKENR
jgi:CHASE3 domain sensor protein